MAKDKDKKKKEKITYVDDGRSFADFGGDRVGAPRGSLRDQARTFFGAMKMMFVPMLVTMGIITVAFLLVRLALMFAA